MSKISITIDVSKINKSKIIERKYINRDKKEVVVKEYKVDLVELKEPKVIKDDKKWVLKKTHFLAEAQSKEEQARKDKSVFVGEGFRFFEKNDAGGVDFPIDVGVDEDINPEDIPF